MYGRFLIDLTREKINLGLKRNHGFPNQIDVVYECLQNQSIPHTYNFLLDEGFPEGGANAAIT
jgi:hypothetical protein